MGNRSEVIFGKAERSDFCESIPRVAVYVRVSTEDRAHSYENQARYYTKSLLRDRAEKYEKFRNEEMKKKLMSYIDWRCKRLSEMLNQEEEEEL